MRLFGLLSLRLLFSGTCRDPALSNDVFPPEFDESRVSYSLDNNYVQEEECLTCARIEKKMTDKDELYRGKAGKKASCKKMRGMNEKQKARKKCEIEWGEETAGRVEQHFLFADRHHLHLLGINIIAVT